MGISINTAIFVAVVFMIGELIIVDLVLSFSAGRRGDFLCRDASSERGASQHSEGWCRVREAQEKMGESRKLLHTVLSRPKALNAKPPVRSVVREGAKKRESVSVS